jgi:hypothetical protein
LAWAARSLSTASCVGSRARTKASNSALSVTLTEEQPSAPSSARASLTLSALPHQLSLLEGGVDAAHACLWPLFQ